MSCIFFSILFSSYVNVQEIKLVMELIKLIKDKRRDINFRNIGIITHYKAQKTMIQKDLDKEFDRKGWGISVFIALSSFSVELKRRKRGWKERRKWNLTPGACIDPGNIEQGDQDAGSTDLCWEGSVTGYACSTCRRSACCLFEGLHHSTWQWNWLRSSPGLSI